MCRPVRVKVVYGPSELTVVNFKCRRHNLAVTDMAVTDMSQANPSIVTTTAAAAATSHQLPMEVSSDMPRADCTGQHHHVELRVEMPYDKLSKPDIRSQFAEYLESMLWKSAHVYLSFELHESRKEHRDSLTNR